MTRALVLLAPAPATAIGAGVADYLGRRSSTQLDAGVAQQDVWWLARVGGGRGVANRNRVHADLEHLWPNPEGDLGPCRVLRLIGRAADAILEWAGIAEAHLTIDREGHGGVGREILVVESAHPKDDPCRGNLIERELEG